MNGFSGCFEGGQSPLQRRLPKFGFNPPNRTVYAVVNLADLENVFESGATVDVDALENAGLVKGRYDGVKLLGQGALTIKVTVRVHKASEAAREAVQKAGGTVEVLPLMAHKPESAAKAHAGKGVKAPRQPQA